MTPEVPSTVSMALVLEFANIVNSGVQDFQSLSRLFHTATESYVCNPDVSCSMDTETSKKIEMESRIWDLMGQLYAQRQEECTDSRSEKELKIIKNWLSILIRPRADVEKLVSGSDELYAHILYLLLANEPDEAIQVCEIVHEYYVILALRCDTDHSKSACVAICKKAPKRSAKRALFGFIGGDRESVLDFVDTWEAQLLVLIHAPPFKEKESHIQSNGGVHIMESLEALESSSNMHIRAETNSFTRRIISSIIRNDLNTFIASESDKLYSLLHDTHEPQTDTSVSDSEDLRLLVHISLALSQRFKPCQSVVDVLLKVYIEYLSLEKAYHLATVYMAQLSPEEQSQVLALAMIQREDVAGIRTQIDLARDYAIDVPTAIQHAIKTWFAKYLIPPTKASYPRYARDSNSEAERLIKLREIIELLCEEDMWETVSFTMQKVLDTLLSEGRVFSALDFINMKCFGHISAQECTKRPGMRTLAFTSQLVTTLSCIYEWGSLLNDAYFAKDSTPPIFFIKGLESSRESIEVLKVAAEDLLSYLGDFELSRAAYVPFLFLELFRLLRRMTLFSNRYYGMAVDVAATMVNDDGESNLYSLFKSCGLLESLLQQIMV